MSRSKFLQLFLTFRFTELYLRRSVNKIRRPLEAQPSPTPVEPIIRPRDHTNRIQGIMEDYLKRLKERDHHWEDLVDVRLSNLLRFTVSQSSFRTHTNPMSHRLQIGTSNLLYLYPLLKVVYVLDDPYDYVLAEVVECILTDALSAHHMPVAQKTIRAYLHRTLKDRIAQIKPI